MKSLRVVSQAVGWIALLATACAPLALDEDLRAAPPADVGEDAGPDAGPSDTGVPSSLSTCELHGSACVSRAELEARFGSDRCPNGLIDQQLPCETRPDFATAWICCGTTPPPPESVCETQGDLCWNMHESHEACPRHFEPHLEQSCALTGEPRPQLSCCRRTTEPPMGPCEMQGFLCVHPVPVAQTCPPRFTEVALGCPPDEHTAERLVCCR